MTGIFRQPEPLLFIKEGLVYDFSLYKRTVCLAYVRA